MKVNSRQERSENVLSGINKPAGPKSRPGKKVCKIPNVHRGNPLSM